MRGKAVQTLVCAALLLLLPLAAADHGTHLEQVSATTVSQHGHGPYAPCPPAHTSLCVACAAAGLFAAPPALAGLALPQLSLESALTFSSLVSLGAATRPSGRSPPAS